MHVMFRLVGGDASPPPKSATAWTLDSVFHNNQSVKTSGVKIRNNSPNSIKKRASPEANLITLFKTLKQFSLDS